MRLNKLMFGLVLATGFMATATAQIVMRNAISVAENSHAGEAVVTLAKEVEKRTNGRIIIKNFFSGSFLSDRTVRNPTWQGPGGKMKY